MFKEILQKSVVGFFFGLGASIAAFSIILFYEANRSQVKGWFGPNYTFLHGKELSGVEITAHKQRQDTEKYTVVGKVQNNSEIPIRGISIEVQILDGEFLLGRCVDGVDRGQYLNKGESGFFSVECRNLTTAENKYPYKVLINSAVAYEK